MTQFNHGRELTKEALRATALFIDNGIPAMNQTVLLKRVNDDADTLERLCNALLANRIKPYYLFQGDLVSGTAHLRVSIEDGMKLEAELRRRLSGLAMPLYALDLPEGGGKIPLVTSYSKEEKTESWSSDSVWRTSFISGRLADLLQNLIKRFGALLLSESLILGGSQLLENGLLLDRDAWRNGNPRGRRLRFLFHIQRNRSPDRR